MSNWRTEQENMQHYIIRVKDGNNFRNSKLPYWAMKSGKNGCIKSVIKKIKPGSILWFLTSKKYGSQIIGMAQYCRFYDINDEPLLQINTISNEDQNWKGDECWNIQIHYTNLYITEKQNIYGCISHSSSILEYEKYKEKINGDLYEHYKNYRFYAEPNIF
jgi:hypothetical protein